VKNEDEVRGFVHEPNPPVSRTKPILATLAGDHLHIPNSCADESVNRVLYLLTVAIF
jgi:hypothetical protein